MPHDLIRLMHSLFLPAAEAAREAYWQPPTDVYRTRKGWLVKFDVAGVPPEDIELRVRGSHLTISGTRRDWCSQEGCTHYLMEISYSHFERSITLPIDLEHASITSEYRYGLLLIHIQVEGEQ
jgi:HSP20 family protein